eukprot:16451882-Heterocapsa_arctica.AAC.1
MKPSPSKSRSTRGSLVTRAASATLVRAWMRNRMKPTKTSSSSLRSSGPAASASAASMAHTRRAKNGSAFLVTRLPL